MEKNKEDFNYYTYKVGIYYPSDWASEEEKKNFKPYVPETKKLVWNIFVEENNKILVRNLFEYCWPFLQDLLQIKKKYGGDFTKFADNVRRRLQHEYWSRCQHEVIITSWPPYIDEKELTKLNKSKEESISKGFNFYRESLDLTCEYKMDVYTQIMLNWDRFIEYLFKNQKLITKKKLGL